MNRAAPIIFILIALLVSTGAYAAVLDLRNDTFNETRIMDQDWEYSENTIVPLRRGAGAVCGVGCDD